ncbi:MAG: OmpA family protein, partial [Myxococcota bacterium]
FEYDSAVIKEESHRLLEIVARTIELNPELGLIEIQGHTDERGPAAYNLELSQRRSESVVRFLVSAGVSGDKLQARGFGESQPIDRGRNPRAWAANRRVEFVIRERVAD